MRSSAAHGRGLKNGVFEEDSKSGLLMKGELDEVTSIILRLRVDMYPEPCAAPKDEVSNDRVSIRADPVRRVEETEGES